MTHWRAPRREAADWAEALAVIFVVTAVAVFACMGLQMLRGIVP